MSLVERRTATVAGRRMRFACRTFLRQDWRVTEVHEQPLTGGAQTNGLVRIGMTVRWTIYPRADLVDALLRHLEAVGFQGASGLWATTIRGGRC